MTEKLDTSSCSNCNFTDSFTRLHLCINSFVLFYWLIVSVCQFVLAVGIILSTLLTSFFFFFCDIKIVMMANMREPGVIDMSWIGFPLYTLFLVFSVQVR